LTDQTEAFEGQDLDAKPPEKRMRWTCQRCGSESVLGVSLLDERQRYAIAARCVGCHKTGVTVVRELTEGERKD